MGAAGAGLLLGAAPLARAQAADTVRRFSHATPKRARRNLC